MRHVSVLADILATILFSLTPITVLVLHGFSLLCLCKNTDCPTHPFSFNTHILCFIVSSHCDQMRLWNLQLFPISRWKEDLWIPPLEVMSVSHLFCNGVEIWRASQLYPMSLVLSLSLSMEVVFLCGIQKNITVTNIIPQVSCKSSRRPYLNVKSEESGDCQLNLLAYIFGQCLH